MNSKTRMHIWAMAVTLLAASSAARSQSWTTGTISYNGAGDITTMGADSFVYDSAGRVVKATADQQRTGGSNRQEYSYDALGNRLTTARVGVDCVGGCPASSSYAVSTATNRVTDHGAQYDGAGNLTALDGAVYAYDGAGMMARQTAGAVDWQFIYTADDERIATYTGSGNWQFTVRDLDGKVLREVLASTGQSGTTWTWSRDQVFRDGLPLASVGAGWQQQFHLDHLGSPPGHERIRRADRDPCLLRVRRRDGHYSPGEPRRAAEVHGP